jgi:hypothetical protein
MKKFLYEVWRAVLGLPPKSDKPREKVRLTSVEFWFLTGSFLALATIFVIILIITTN